MKKLLTFTLLATLITFVSPVNAKSVPNDVKQQMDISKKEISAKVNINTANAEQIANTLKGVGIKRAEAIISYRETHGLFKSIESLAEVKGISLKTVEKIL